MTDYKKPLLNSFLYIEYSMNEQRQQAYFNVIQNLLNNYTNQETKFLTENIELIDIDFLQIVEARARTFLRQEDQERPVWLKDLAAYLEEILNLNTTVDLLSLSKSEIQAYLQFIIDVLRTIRSSNGDPRMVYPLFEVNINNLNGFFFIFLYYWIINILIESKSEEIESIIEDILEFTKLIVQFSLGNLAINVEIGVIYSKLAIAISTSIDSLQSWAKSQIRLCSAYISRTLGDKAENLEKAIVANYAAQKVFTPTTFPQQWAETQFILSVAYINRVRDDKSENLEKSITFCNAALEFLTFNNHPRQWAMIQTNLGIAYIDRIRGDKAENLEEAITAFSATLKVFTRNTFPQQWARTQSNLGIAYRARIKGDKAENLEMAITASNASLEIFTLKAFPQFWAATQTNLGMAYRGRIREDKKENLEKAIESYQQALTVYTFDTFPELWARLQNNIGNSYIERISDDKVNDFELSINAFKKAFTIYTYNNFPEQWARLQNNIGIAYRDRIIGDKSHNLILAIEAFQQALIVRNRDIFPSYYAETLFNQGIAYQEANCFKEAYENFKLAIKTIESLRTEIISGEESKRKQAEEWNKYYSSMIAVCLKLDNVTEAIEYIERSKTRNLVEQILERDSHTIFPPDVIIQLELYRDEISTGQKQIQNSKVENLKALAQHLQELRQQRNELQNRYLPAVGYDFKFDSFYTTLNERTAIIEWYILSDKILALIVIPGKKIIVWQSQPADLKLLESWKNQYLEKDKKEKNYWRNNLGKELKNLASILHIDEVLRYIPSYCDQLILIPHRFLHLFPLHALPLNDDSENPLHLLDLFTNGVSYAPSCQLLQQLQKRKRPDFQSLFAVQNPTEDLFYTDLEVQVTQNYFDTSNILKKSAATLFAINNHELNSHHCVHFSCHGYFNLTNPNKSALILADASVDEVLPTNNFEERYPDLRFDKIYNLDKCLTLDKVFNLKLEKCRLVTLSACETGLIDFINTSDEYIGLPSGFILAGSPSVVSSLWKVSDVSTSFLMIKFYENLIEHRYLKEKNIAIALNQAQQWLKNLTMEKFEELLKQYNPQIEQILSPMRKGQRLKFEESLKLIRQRQPFPFANPYYWGAFITSGF